MQNKCKLNIYSNKYLNIHLNMYLSMYLNNFKHLFKHLFKHILPITTPILNIALNSAPPCPSRLAAHLRRWCVARVLRQSPSFQRQALQWWPQHCGHRGKQRAVEAQNFSETVSKIYKILYKYTSNHFQILNFKDKKLQNTNRTPKKQHTWPRGEQKDRGAQESESSSSYQERLEFRWQKRLMHRLKT